MSIPKLIILEPLDNSINSVAGGGGGAGGATVEERGKQDRGSYRAA